MEKLKLHSPDLTAQNIEKLADLFPSCVTEAADDNGEIVRSIDFDQLKQELSAHIVDGPRERYQLTWPGKREALLTANAPIAKTLRPVRDESVDFDTTKNLLIKGDNLDALKLLQETYLNRAKMIFIDPPYNTGNDFIYEDDYSENGADFLVRSNQVDQTGNRLSANPEYNGRFHSNWLSFIYPRLKIARNLLRDDGAIFISIDDNEQFNLRSICNEIFGSENFVANIIWQHSIQPKGYTGIFSLHHNHILMYQRSDAFDLKSLERTEEDNKAYSNPDNDPRGDWRTGDVRNALFRPNLRYKLETPSGKFIDPPENGWRWSKETMRQKIDSGEIVFRDDETKIIRKIYLDTLEGRTPETIWFGKDAGTTRDGARELKEDFDGEAPFDTAKPTSLIKRMATIAGVQSDDLVIDFFAGSGATGITCMREALGRFILVQLDEPIDETKPHGKVARRLGFKVISDITVSRLQRTSDQLQTSKGGGSSDRGFRVLEIDSSNMREVYYSPDEVTKDDLLSQVDNIREGRTSEDLLFQVLLDWGVDLSLPIKRETISGKEVYFVDENAVAACFEQGVTEELVKEIAGRHPLRVVFRDNGFVSDAVKINVEQIFKLLSPETDVKSI